jgi:hypothetical protein
MSSLNKQNVALRLAMAGVFAAMTVPAMATVVLDNGFIKAGVSDYGTLGSNDTTPPGIQYDSTGTGTYINDILTPGNPFEGFYITGVTSTGDSYFNGSNNDPYWMYGLGFGGFGASSPLSGGATDANWTGIDAYFIVLNGYTLTTLGGQSVIAITTTLTNISGDYMHGVKFLRTLDPDPDGSNFNVYDTTNVVLSDDIACATGTGSGQTICAYSFDNTPHKAGVSSWWSTDPAVYLSGVNDGNGDNAIGVAFNIGTIAANDSVTITYGYSLRDISGAGTGGGGGGGGASVPEPASLALLGLGLVGLSLSRRRKAA